MFLMESCLNSSIETEIYTKMYTKYSSQQLAFIFFSNTFLIDFSLDELNTAKISFLKWIYYRKIRRCFHE